MTTPTTPADVFQDMNDRIADQEAALATVKGLRDVQMAWHSDKSQVTDMSAAIDALELKMNAMHNSASNAGVQYDIQNNSNNMANYGGRTKHKLPTA